MRGKRTRVLGAGMALALAATLAACGSSGTKAASNTGSSPSSSSSTSAGSSGGTAMTTKTDFGPGCSSVPKSGAGSFSGMTSAPVATAASNNPVLSTLVTAVKKAGLVDTLNNASGLTVFAPANSAFAKIPSATLSSVLANKAELTKILEYHVLAGQLTPSMLAGTHKTLEGSTLSVSGSGTSFTVNGSAKVVCGYVKTANATVYIISSVLMPPAATSSVDFGPGCSAVPSSGAGSFSGMTSAPVATAASNNPVLSTLVTAVKTAGLVDTLNNAKGITVFAPANSAFAKIPAATLKSVLANKAELTKILEYHVVSGELTPANLAGTHKTLEGTSLTVTGSGSSFTVNGSAQVLCGNVQTANAHVYIISSVLMPKG